MLGVDWTTLQAARVRLLTGAWTITTALALIAIAMDAALPTNQSGPGLPIVVVTIAALASMLALRSVSRLPLLIARNDSSTADRYRALAKLSPTQSLLGYRVRWILLRHAVTAASAIALVALMARGW
jgi:hypothetical protein